MTFKAKATVTPAVHLKQTLEAFDKDMREFLLKTLAVWVTESTNPVPVWSGASRASFLKLAAAANVVVAIAPVAPPLISFGDSVSTGEVNIVPGQSYGWVWSSRVPWIDLVQNRVGFQEIGIEAISNLKPANADIVFEKGVQV